jgi:hypothetical protein
MANEMSSLLDYRLAYGVQKGNYLSDTFVVHKRAEVSLDPADKFSINVNAEKYN